MEKYIRRNMVYKLESGTILQIVNENRRENTDYHNKITLFVSIKIHSRLNQNKNISKYPRISS